MKKVFSIIAVFLICASASFAQSFQVKVVRISDGDTFVGLNRDNLQLKFRIWGIDAPEKGQAFGAKSKEHLSSLIFGKTITVDVKKTDGWGRFVAYVYTPDNKDVSLEMIEAGFAWHYKQYDDSSVYENAEKEARKNRRGLWIDANPVAPWNYRKKE